MVSFLQRVIENDIIIVCKIRVLWWLLEPPLLQKLWLDQFELRLYSPSEKCAADKVVTLIKRWTDARNHLQDVELTLKKDWKCKLDQGFFLTLKQRWYYVVSLINHILTVESTLGVVNVINHNSMCNRRWNNVEITSEMEVKKSAMNGRSIDVCLLMFDQRL